MRHSCPALRGLQGTLTAMETAWEVSLMHKDLGGCSRTIPQFNSMAWATGQGSLLEPASHAVTKWTTKECGLNNLLFLPLRGASATCLRLPVPGTAARSGVANSLAKNE